MGIRPTLGEMLNVFIIGMALTYFMGVTRATPSEFFAELGIIWLAGSITGLFLGAFGRSLLIMNEERPDGMLSCGFLFGVIAIVVTTIGMAGWQVWYYLTGVVA